MDKEKEQAISNAIEAMINVPYDVTEAEQAKKIQQQAAEIRARVRPEGRYSIEDAVILLRAETGDYYPLVKAVESGDIPCYKHEAGDKKGDPQDLRSYVCWDDLNKWIEEKTDIRKFRFPNPNAPTAKVEAVRLPVATQQNDAILNWLKASQYDPLKLPVPPSGKAGVKKLCRDALCKSSKQLFSSASVFNTAWDRLRANDEIKDASDTYHPATHP